MRTIKFRAKMSKTREWVVGSLIRQQMRGYKDSYCVLILDNVFTSNKIVAVDQDTVGQFTGLHDKNGKEIYEGDILKCYDDYPEHWVRVVRYSADLVEETPTPGFVLANVKGVSGTDTFDEYDEFEVIGNVFDNPSLIQKPHQKPTLL